MIHMERANLRGSHRLPAQAQVGASNQHLSLPVSGGSHSATHYMCTQLVGTGITSSPAWPVHRLAFALLGWGPWPVKESASTFLDLEPGSSARCPTARSILLHVETPLLGTGGKQARAAESPVFTVGSPLGPARTLEAPTSWQVGTGKRGGRLTLLLALASCSSPLPRRNTADIQLVCPSQGHESCHQPWTHML